jgi:hypothetical protein
MKGSLHFAMHGGAGSLALTLLAPSLNNVLTDKGRSKKIESFAVISFSWG